MKRTVYIARTADDLTHVNRLGIPQFGVVALCLAAGGKSSKSYLPDDAPAVSGGGSGDDGFHFAPEKETIEIRYEIDDRFCLVDGAKLELFTRFNDVPLWSLDLSKLGPDWFAHGKHTVKWDGRIVTPSEKQEGTQADGGMSHDLTSIDADNSLEPFPDGFVTLEHTPYKMKLTLSSTSQPDAGLPVVAWTFWHILLHSIELELGPQEAIPAATVDDDEHKRNKAVYKQVKDDGGIPASGSTLRVYLLSNLYKTSLGQMDDNTGFEAYKTLWGDGAQIPIVAKLRIADSGDNPVKLDESDKGAVALGKVKFLWDWTDPDETVTGLSAKPQAFVANAINYYKDGTDAARSGDDHKYPKGDNCHVDRGGKRGPGATTVFPAQAGYGPQDTLDAGKCPFKVEASTDRPWAAFSQGWTKGALKGRTGVTFQPARMAGDDYVLTVYLAYDRSAADKLVLDNNSEPLQAPDKIQKSTGTLQIWRRAHLSRYIKKTSAMAAFMSGAAGNIAAHYADAYIDLVDKTGGNNTYAVSDHRLADGSAPNYNNLARARLTGSGNVLFTSNLATDAAADHASVDSMYLVRSYGDFVSQLHTALHGGAGAGDLAALAGAWGGTQDAANRQIGVTNMTAWPANARNNRLKATQNWLKTSNLETPAKYAGRLDDIFFGFGEGLTGDLQCVSGSKNGVGTAAEDGIITLEFNYTNTFLRDEIAGGVGLGYWYGAAVDPGDADLNHSVIAFWKAGVDEFSHEAGHHFFLPHAKYPTASPPGGAQENRHDDTDSGCLMSYSSVRPSFCGLCLLRLRGWDATNLSKVSADNKKP